MVMLASTNYREHVAYKKTKYRRKRKMDMPNTTLFMLMSLDGKISTGSTDELDVDKDLKLIDGVKEGIHQYYEIEQTTDLWSFNTGRVMQKIGINEKSDEPNKTPVSFILVDNEQHINEKGLKYLSNWLNKVIIVTTKKDYIDIGKNIEIIYYENEIDFIDLFELLKNRYNIENLTVQSGGTLNSILIRNNLINKVRIIIAPVIIGGKDTATLVDGISLVDRSDLSKLKALKLVKCNILENSYLELLYEIIKEVK